MLRHVPSPSPTGDAALAYLRRRRGLLARLARVNAAITRWDEREANVYLPADLRGNVPLPALGRETLAGLHRTLAEELRRLEEGPQEH